MPGLYKACTYPSCGQLARLPFPRDVRAHDAPACTSRQSPFSFTPSPSVPRVHKYRLPSRHRTRAAAEKGRERSGEHAAEHGDEHGGRRLTGGEAPDGGGERHLRARGGGRTRGRRGAGGAVPARLPGAVVLVAPPDGPPGRARLPLRGARPPRLRRHRRAARRHLLLRLPRRRRPRRAPRRPRRPPKGVRGGSRLGRDHRVVPLPLEAGARDGARQHQRRLRAPRPHPRRLRRRRRQAHRPLPPRLRPHLLHLPLPGARGGGEGVRAGARQAAHDADPGRPLQRPRGGRRRGGGGERGRVAAAGAPSVADRGGHRLLRGGVREDGVHRRHQLLPELGQELGAGGAVGGRQGGGADQVHRGGRRPDVPLRGDPGVPARRRVQGGRAAAGGASGRHPRRRPLHPAGEGAGGQRPHLPVHLQVPISSNLARSAIAAVIDMYASSCLYVPEFRTGFNELTYHAWK